MKRSREEVRLRPLWIYTARRQGGSSRCSELTEMKSTQGFQGKEALLGYDFERSAEVTGNGARSEYRSRRLFEMKATRALASKMGGGCGTVCYALQQTLQSKGSIEMKSADGLTSQVIKEWVDAG